MAEPFFQKYIDRVSSDDLIDQMKNQREAFVDWVSNITEEQSVVVHPPYTWTLREVVNHINDGERVFAFRSFWTARGGAMPMVEYDEHQFALRAHANDTHLGRWIVEFDAIRRSTILQFESFSSDDWQQQGMMGNHAITVRTLAEIIVGHVAHHFSILQRRFA